MPFMWSALSPVQWLRLKLIKKQHHYNNTLHFQQLN